MTGCNRLIHAADAAVEVLYSNVAFLSGINQPFRIYNSGPEYPRGLGDEDTPQRQSSGALLK